MVSYGLSSIQAVSNAAGLHKFKTKLGFEARPVHRAFVAHPLLRPFDRTASRTGRRRAAGARPGNRVLKKCDGVLSTMLGRRTLVETQDWPVRQLLDAGLALCALVVVTPLLSSQR